MNKRDGEGGGGAKEKNGMEIYQHFVSLPVNYMIH